MDRDTHICSSCGKSGSLTADDAIAAKNTLLSEDDSGNLVCLPCYMEGDSICLYCSEEADLMPDATCRAMPQLCEKCLNLPFRVHMYSCYSDGCMTPEEFAAECERTMELDEEGETLFGLLDDFDVDCDD